MVLRFLIRLLLNILSSREWKSIRFKIRRKWIIMIGLIGIISITKKKIGIIGIIKFI